MKVILYEKSPDLIGNITHVTLFYWRHKLFSSLKQIVIPNVEGVVELQETNFLYSEKRQEKLNVENHVNMVVLRRNMV